MQDSPTAVPDKKIVVLIPADVKFSLDKILDIVKSAYNKAGLETNPNRGISLEKLEGGVNWAMALALADFNQVYVSNSKGELKLFNQITNF